MDKNDVVLFSYLIKDTDTHVLRLDGPAGGEILDRLDDSKNSNQKIIDKLRGPSGTTDDKGNVLSGEISHNLKDQNETPGLHYDLNKIVNKSSKYYYYGENKNKKLRVFYKNWKNEENNYTFQVPYMKKFINNFTHIPSLNNQFTISFWCKPKSSENKEETVNKVKIYPQVFYFGGLNQNNFNDPLFKDGMNSKNISNSIAINYEDKGVYNINYSNSRNNYKVKYGKKDSNTDNIGEKWLHCVITYDGKMRRIYINGVEMGSKSLDKDMTHDNYQEGQDYVFGLKIENIENFVFGSSPNDGPNKSMIGLLSDFKIYDEYFTHLQVKELFNDDETRPSANVMTKINNEKIRMVKYAWHSTGHFDSEDNQFNWHSALTEDNDIRDVYKSRAKPEYSHPRALDEKHKNSSKKDVYRTDRTCTVLGYNFKWKNEECSHDRNTTLCVHKLPSNDDRIKSAPPQGKELKQINSNDLKFEKGKFLKLTGNGFITCDIMPKIIPYGNNNFTISVNIKPDFPKTIPKNDDNFIAYKRYTILSYGRYGPNNTNTLCIEKTQDNKYFIRHSFGFP